MVTKSDIQNMSGKKLDQNFAEYKIIAHKNLVGLTAFLCPATPPAACGVVKNEM